VKYLPRHGWLPSVLTTSNASVPVWDQSLLREVPERVVVRRARTLEPSYAAKAAVASGVAADADAASAAVPLTARVCGATKRFAQRTAKLLLQPDPQVLWIPDAVRTGKRLLHEIRHDVVVVSGPPFSTFFVGAALARHARLPLVLDFRDEWDLSNAYWENKRHGQCSLAVQSWMQRSLLRRARVLIATSRSSAAALEAKRRLADSRARVAYIYNGFDPDDFAETPAADTVAEHGRCPDHPLRIAYVGTLWNLTSVEPVVRAVEELAVRRPDLVRRLELSFVGRRTPEQQEILNRLKRTACRLVEYPYLEHHRAIRMLRSADLLCVLMSEVPGAGRVVPAKLFEYMAVRRPILAVSPRGEVWDLLADYPVKRLEEPIGVSAIADHLAADLERHVNGVAPDAAAAAFAAWDASPHTRPAQAGQLARILDSLMAQARA
jgi:glycosyltransferase involved in cell wall biosynthesis